jgi:hypothetical protein
LIFLCRTSMGSGPTNVHSDINNQSPNALYDVQPAV